MNYRIDVTDKGTGQPIRSGYGDLKLLSYVANSAQKHLDTSPVAEVSVSVDEVDASGNVLRTVISFTGDSETASVVLKAKVGKVRKDANDA